jgi:hypothetical protein
VRANLHLVFDDFRFTAAGGDPTILARATCKIGRLSP